MEAQLAGEVGKAAPLSKTPRDLAVEAQLAGEVGKQQEQRQALPGQRQALTWGAPATGEVASQQEQRQALPGQRQALT